MMITDILECRRIFLTLTTKCNISCEKCWRREVYGEGEDVKDNVLLSFFNIFSQYRGIIHIGTGENTVAKKLETFVDWINDSHAKTVILTNGTNISALGQKYFTHRIKWGVTFDGFTDDELENFQYGIDIDSVKNSITEIKSRYPYSNIYLNYTLTNKNIKSLRDFIEFGIRNKITELYITPLKGFVDFNEDRIIPYIPSIENTHTRLLISGAVEFAKRNNININNPLDEMVVKQCGIDKISPVINVNGNVSFCYEREGIVLGSLLERNIREIFALYFENGNADKICSECKINRSKTRDKRGLYFR